MMSQITFQKPAFFLVFFSILNFSLLAQTETSEWKLQLGVGINNPIDDIENDGYYAKSANFPTINLGIQHMFHDHFGAKLDLGYNRANDADGSLPFKLNYTRINAQGVYDFTYLLPFIPIQMATLVHAGPGISFTKPLADLTENKYTFLNVLGGLEVHYGVSRSFSVFGDVGYALSLSGKDKYDPDVNGYAFNGNLFYVTFGVSVSLSGCRTC